MKKLTRGSQFQLTRLMRGVTDLHKQLHLDDMISTHTPHARRDGLYANRGRAEVQFQLTRLMRGVTGLRRIYANTRTFQLTRLMRGVTLKQLSGLQSLFNFNSHASCEA